MSLVKRKKKIVNPEGDSVEIESNSQTPWENLVEGSIIPIRLTCQDYTQSNRADMSCHTNLQIAGQSVVNHLSPEHGSGGGFLLQLRHRPGQTTTFWKELSDAGIELHDFRCDICDENLPLTPRRIIRHIAAHAGKFRAARAGGAFWMTLRFETPDSDGDEYQD